MAKTLDKPLLYDTDYVAWLEDQVAHLRAGRLSALDVDNVAEELDELMRSQRQQLENRLEVLIVHLLKWDHQPGRRANRWRASVEEQRTRIRRLLRDSPSLKREIEPMCLPGCRARCRHRDAPERDRVPAELTLFDRADVRARSAGQELSDQRPSRKKRP